MAVTILAIAISGCDDGFVNPGDPNLVTSISITPDASEIPFGAPVEFQAIPRNYRGEPLTRTVSWSSSDPSIVVADPFGRVHAVKVGSAAIEATVAGVSASVEVQVPVPDALLGTLSLFTADGKTLPAHVFAEMIPDFGFLEMIATDGSLIIAEDGRYTQQVIHEGRLDGVPFGTQDQIDRGKCQITEHALTCESDLIQNQWFAASHALGSVDSTQDFVREPGFPRPVVYRFSQIHIGE